MIGGLPTLLRLLESAQPGIRARAAEVLAMCSQANPPVQARPAPHLIGWPHKAHLPLAPGSSTLCFTARMLPRAAQLAISSAARQRPVRCALGAGASFAAAALWLALLHACCAPT